MSDEAERAWERYEKERGRDEPLPWRDVAVNDLMAIVDDAAKQAFLAGFAAGRKRPGEYVGEAEEEP